MRPTLPLRRTVPRARQSVRAPPGARGVRARFRTESHARSPNRARSGTKDPPAAPPRAPTRAERSCRSRPAPRRQARRPRPPEPTVRTPQLAPARRGVPAACPRQNRPLGSRTKPTEVRSPSEGTEKPRGRVHVAKRDHRRHADHEPADAMSPRPRDGERDRRCITTTTSSTASTWTSGRPPTAGVRPPTRTSSSDSWRPTPVAASAASRPSVG